MRMRACIWVLALVTVTAQAANWIHLGHTEDYDLYIDSASIQHQTGGRVAFQVKREYSHDQASGQPSGAGRVEFMAIGDLVGDCVRRTVTVVSVTIRRPTGQVLEREKTPNPMPTPVEPGSVREAELNAACGIKKPQSPHG